MKELVIDVSKWQGIIDFNAVQSSGIYGVIIKAGGSDNGFYTDPYFEQNYSKAVNAGLHVGTYYYVGPKCTSGTDGNADAVRFYEIIKGKKFDLPVYMDFEAPPASTRQGNTDAAIAFCDYMEDKGYYAGIYGSDESGFMDRLDHTRLRDYAWWVADYSNEPTHAVPFGMWQFTSKGKVNGIYGNVDQNYLYIDYPYVIKSIGLNGYNGVLGTEGTDHNTAVTGTIAVGDHVRIKAGATDMNTGTLYADFVYTNTYTVKEVTGKRVVFGNESGITGATSIDNVIKV